MALLIIWAYNIYMKYVFILFIFISILIIIFLLPLYSLVWQEGILLSNIKTTHGQALKTEDAIKHGQQIIVYLKNKQTINQDFSINESKHMQDVKNLFILGKWILIIASIILFLIFLFLKYLGDTTIYFQVIKYGAFFSIFLLFGLGVLTLMDFAGSFLYFHHIFFPQGNFLFPFDSLLINIFTERFFKDISGLMWLGSFLLSGIFVGISIYKIKISKTI